MLCPNCETDNRECAKFCDECGFPLTGAIAARAAEAAGAPDGGAVGIADDAEKPEQANGSGKDSEASFGEGATEVIEGLDPEDEDGGEAVGSAPADEAGAGEADVPDDREAAQADDTAAIDVDFAGLDQMEEDYGERLVDPGYKEPQANWRDGNTMQLPRIEGEEAPRSRDFLASSTTKQGKGKKVAVGIVAAVVAVAAIIAFATYQMQLWGGKAVPDVRGMTEADATSVLENSGFEVRSTQVKSDDTEGLVLVMDPAAGARAEEGDEVVIHIATAREIPDVVGKPEADAKEAFEDAGYENVTYAKEHSDFPEGTVLSVSPDAGTRAKSSIAVTVKVAEPYTVPDTSELGLSDAIAAIQAEGLMYDIAYVDTQEYVDGTVIGTEPAAGAKVPSDTVVVIEVARARGIQLAQLTREIIAPGYELNIGGTNYIVNSLDAVSYLGDDQVSFTVTARPYTVFFGVYVEGDAQKVSGVVTYTADNGVASIS